MSRYNAHNMRGWTSNPGWCVICGRPHAEGHHVVARSLGGARGPVLSLCGFGNNLRDADGRLLHHGLAEHHLLWFWFDDGTDCDLAPRLPRYSRNHWCYVLADRPVDEMEALRMDGWRVI